MKKNFSLINFISSLSMVRKVNLGLAFALFCLLMSAPIDWYMSGVNIIPCIICAVFYTLAVLACWNAIDDLLYH